MIFLFSYPSGEDFGYKDHFDESGIFHYTGEGKVGDMTFAKGNKAIRNHVEDGKELLLFESIKKGTPLQFIGYFKYLGHHNETRPDQNGEWRQAIIFELTFSNSPHQSIDFASNLYLATQSIYSSIRENDDMKKLTTEDIKQILNLELEKSKRHTEHYYFGTNRFSKAEKFKSLAKNEEQEEKFLQDLKTDYQQTLKQFKPKVREVLEEHGFPNVAVDSVEFKHLRDELIELRLTRHEMKRVMLEEKQRQDSGSTLQRPIQTIINQVPIQIESTTNSLTLSELSKLFLETRVGGGYAEKTILDYQDTHRLLLEVLGDIPVDSLTHEHGRTLVQVLRKLPSNRNKKYPNHSTEECIFNE